MPFPVTLNGRTYTEKDFLGLAYVKGLPDALQDFVTHAAALHSATSNSSITVAVGPKAVTIQAGKPWRIGAPLRISRTSAPTTTWMDGVVTAHNETTGVMTVDVTAFAGSGTFTDWTINVGGGGALVASNPVTVAQGGTGGTTQSAARVGIGAIGGPTGAASTDINRIALWNATDGTLVKNGPALGNAGEALISQGPGQPPVFTSIVGATTGDIKLWPTATPPGGWVICNGQALNRITFSALFALIGTSFGAGDGSTTFNVPDFRGRAPIGAGQGSGLTNRLLASTGGAETHQLTTAETPVKAHTHTFAGTTGFFGDHVHDFTTGGQSNDHTHGTVASGTPSGGAAGGAIAGGSATGGSTSGVSTTHTHSGTTGGASIGNHSHNFSGTTGSTENTAATAHNNMQPWISINFVMKT